MQIKKQIYIAISLAILVAAVQAGYILCAVTSSAVAQDAQRTAVVADEKDGVVRIIAGGKEVIVIDETGIYVRGDVVYSGSLIDGLPPHLSKEGGHAK
jgi:hypothetical protein